MDHSDNDLPPNLKRKAVDSLASSGLKKPRLSLAARFPLISSQSKARGLSAQFNKNSRLGGTQILSRKGKEKASYPYRETSFEESGDIHSSTNRPSLSTNSQSASRSGSNLSKANASSSVSNSILGSTKARPSPWSQRKTTLQDPISISSDSDEGKEQSISVKKGKRLWKSTGQMDVVDLTFDDDDDEIRVIEVKKRGPNGMKSRRSLGHRVEKAGSRKSNSFDDERILTAEAPSPITLPTPPKSENDEPESSEDTGIIEQRPRKLAGINGPIKSQVLRVHESRHSLPVNAEVIDLCTDNSGDELPGEPSSTNGHFPSLEDNAMDTHNTMVTLPSSSSGLIDKNASPLPGVGDFSDQLPNEPLGIDGQLHSVADNMETTHDTMSIAPLSSYKNHHSPSPDVGNVSHELPGELLGIDGQHSFVGDNTENAYDTMGVPLSPAHKKHPSPSPGVHDINRELPSEPLGVDGQLGVNTGTIHDSMDIPPPLWSESFSMGEDFSDKLSSQQSGVDGQLPSVGASTKNAHDTMCIFPLELISSNQPLPDVADCSDQLEGEPSGMDGQPLSLEATAENTQDIAGTFPSSSELVDTAGVGGFNDGGIDEQPRSETNTENTRDMDIVTLSSSGPSPSPGVGEPAISSDIDPMEELVDPISELEISPLMNSREEEEVLRDVLLEDDLLCEEEETLIENPVPAMDTSPEESYSNDTQFAQPAKHAPEPADTPDNDFSRGSLVKEPDFSKISTEATEPVPEYDDRLSAAIKWPAEKLPTELHDMINALPMNYLYNPQMRHIFEAMIEDNTAADEPRAPKIRIIGRKNGPVTPPWEFYYTNRIVNGEGVPRSDKKLLQGCDCIGPCDPKSKTCACVQRQMAWTGGEIKGFLYKKERLLHPHYPVFECNDACECSEECMNRVIQHGRRYPLSITLTKNKGWGVFADEKIPRGSFLGIYAGEMILEAEADERGQLYDRYGRTYLFDLDFYHLRALDKDKDKDGDTTTSTYTIDAFHVGNFTRFLNHSCDPNCQITPTYVNEPDLHKPALTIFTSRDVQKGEELTFSYLGEADSEKTDEEVDENMIKVEAGPSSHKQQAVHRRCLCGAANCRGQMF